MWRDGYTPMIVDMARLLRGVATAPDDAGAAEFAERFDADADTGSPGATPSTEPSTSGCSAVSPSMPSTSPDVASWSS